MAQIRKRGKTYSFIVDIGKDPKTGKRKQISRGGFLKKKDAEIAARKIELSLDEGKFVELCKDTLSDFTTEWFENYYKNRIKITSRTNYKYLLEKHILSDNILCHKEISKITTEDIDTFYNQKIEEGYSASYIRKMHEILNLAFKQALKWKKIIINPMENSTPPSINSREMGIWSIEEIEKFLNSCREKRHYLTFLLAIYTGMRRGEILGLKWSDIDFNKKILSVNRSLVHIPNMGYVLTNPKTKHSKRQVPIPNFVINELICHKNSQDEWIDLVGPLYNDNDLVICTNTGAFQDPRNVVRVMKRIIKKSGVTDIRFHDIRHTHASILIDQGVDIVKISKRLGHANPRITLEVYAHLLPNSDNEIADIFHHAIQKSDK